MVEQTPFPAYSNQPLHAILRRSSMPLLLFSAVLFVLLLISYITFLPQFTQLHRPDGTAMSPKEIAQYEKVLTADLTKKEDARVSLVLPVLNATYAELKDAKHARLSLGALKEELVQTASRLGEEGGSVSLLKIGIDGDRVVVEGDVVNVGTRSMTVLAAFVDQVEKLPFVQHLERPAFTRVQNSDGSFHSPFIFQFSVAQ